MIDGDRDQEVQRALAFLDKEDLGALLPDLAEKRLAAGEVLFHVGEASSLVYFLIAGRLAVRKKTGFAEKMQVVALLSPGAPVGEGALFPGQIHDATVVAVEDSRLVSFTSENLAIWRNRCPVQAWKVFSRILYVSHLRLKKSSERLVRVL